MVRDNAWRSLGSESGSKRCGSWWDSVVGPVELEEKGNWKEAVVRKGDGVQGGNKIECWFSFN